jgi:Flp pilus assembly protein TadB
MAAELAIVLAAVAAALTPGPSAGVLRLRRLSLYSGQPTKSRVLRDTRASQAPFLASARAKAVTAVLVGLVACWFVGGLAGPAVGAGLGSLAWLTLRRLESAADVRAREARTQTIPLAAQLLATAVAAGSPPVEATEVVADALGGPLGATLRAAAASARIGADPASDELTLAADPALRPLARALAGAMTRGVSPVNVLDRVAHDARATARWAAEARARSLGARAAAPLGLCFLPAFVLVGIVPVVATAGPFLP